jgi:hypothetical protein
LITLHTNAVDDFAIKYEDKAVDQRVACFQVVPYLYSGTRTVDVTSPHAASDYSKAVVLLTTSAAIGRDVDLHFNRYVHTRRMRRTTPAALPARLLLLPRYCD